MWSALYHIFLPTPGLIESWIRGFELGLEIFIAQIMVSIFDWIFFL
jgi:hypothetical protein